MRRTACFLAFALLGAAQPPADRLTLEQAEAEAVANHPALAAARTEAMAVRTRVEQARAARRPQAYANTTAVGADNESRIVAGALNNPILFSRIGAGVTMSQNLFDFGRTAHLVESARETADASDQRTALARADVILGVRRAYLQALRAENILRVARATVEARQLIVDQVRELVRAKLKTSLDESFAETSLSEAKLLVESAGNESRAAYADLSQAIGRPLPDTTRLSDIQEPSDMQAQEAAAPELDRLQADALEHRADLKALRREREAARETSLAQRAVRLPAVSGMLSMGVTPAGGPKLSTEYAAVGVNISLPLLTGGYQKWAQAESELRVKALDHRLAQQEQLVLRDVKAAWLQTSTARRRIELTRQFVDQAALALDLAQTRYDLGLSTMVEFSQAQLTKTNAELQNAAAKYDYLLWRSILQYRAGGL
ncbi:MAG: TolC family protein [Bryobacterales bacterium]|nr:TolC family protein [Bryobacterales bacterium]